MRAAPTAGAGCHDHRAWCYHDRSAAEVGAAVVAVTTARPAGTTMPASPAAALDGDRYSSLRLIERRQGHGLARRDAENTDADDQCEREKPVHSCLLWFFTFPFVPHQGHSNALFDSLFRVLRLQLDSPKPPLILFRSAR